MYKIRVKQGNVDRKDSERALLTDTAPLDVPLVFSNDGFYSNLKSTTASGGLEAIITKLILSNDKRYTIPYRYRIRRTGVSSRLMSLVHPAAQSRACEFYREYGHLIPYFCRNEEVSLRRPYKIGGTSFVLVKRSGKKAYKGSAIDTLADDKTQRNPASYFAYDKHDRFYKFFSSNEVMDLEKKFRIMRSTDISKCFSSIYSHTMSWAVKDVQHGKESVDAASFSNAFDRLMQFSNYNETNGIPVGSELSRIFAEIILQAADIEMLNRTTRRGLEFGRDFVVRRYVDDYVIFSHDTNSADIVQSCLVAALGVFNLHLSDEKTSTVERPFYTSKSQVISRASSSLNSFRSSLSKNESGLSVPIMVRRPKALQSAFIREIKLACDRPDSGYEAVSAYVIGSIASTIESLIEGWEERIPGARKSRDAYASSFEALLRTLYFFFSVHVTVPDSYRVAKSTILSIRFFQKEHPESLEQIYELVSELIAGLIDNPAIRNAQLADCVPLEVLNVILAMGELPTAYRPQLTEVQDRILKSDVIDYFSLVSLLFYLKDSDPTFSSEVERLLEDRFIPKASPLRNSHDAHFMLDLIACPYLGSKFRKTILAKLQKELQLPRLQGAAQDALLSEMQNAPWFVNWEKVDLLNHLRKKELSAIY